MRTFVVMASNGLKWNWIFPHKKFVFPFITFSILILKNKKKYFLHIFLLWRRSMNESYRRVRVPHAVDSHLYAKYRKIYYNMLMFMCLLKGGLWIINNFCLQQDMLAGLLLDTFQHTGWLWTKDEGNVLKASL